jgi:hypothetical protein
MRTHPMSHIYVDWLWFSDNDCPAFDACEDTKMSLVDLGVCVIMVAAAFRLWLKRDRDKQREVEKIAVEAEYSECGTREHDDSLTDLSRRIWSERKEELRMRYPQYVIREPDSRYSKKAWGKIKEESKTHRRELLPTYIGAGIILLSALTYRYIFDGPFPAVVGPALGVVVTILAGILIVGFVEGRREWKNLGSESLSNKEKIEMEPTQRPVSRR